MENGTGKATPKVHTVSIYNRERIEVVGATEVLSSTDKEIVIKLKDSFMFVFGTGLTVVKLLPEEEELVAQGNITGTKYENKPTKKSLLKKVFK